MLQNLIETIPAGLVFQGTWNADTNTPTLANGTGTTGHFYIVSTEGSTNLDGITDWKVGDWAVFVEQGATDAWEKVDNSSVLDGSGTGGTVTGWAGSGTSNTLTNAPITYSGNNTTFAGDIDLTAGQLELRGDVALDHDGSSLYVKAPASIYLLPGNVNKGNISAAGLLTIAGGGTFGGDVSLELNKSISFNNSTIK